MPHAHGFAPSPDRPPREPRIVRGDPARRSRARASTLGVGLAVGLGLCAGPRTADSRAAAPVPPAVALDLGGGVKLDLVLVRAGSFVMGKDSDRDAKPAHMVTIAKPYYLGACEVSQEQWTAVMGAAHARTTTKDARLPVDTVEWWEAHALYAKLTAKFVGKTFRLPTEAEWEYACRAGGTTTYGHGDDAAGLADYAWYRRDGDPTPNPKVKGVADTHPVGGKKANAWGLHDMHGNVWAWCQTGWKGYPYAADDGREALLPRKPDAPTDPRALAGARVLRGGSWHHGAKAATSYSRAASNPADHRYYYGCRVAMVVPE